MTPDLAPDDVVHALGAVASPADLPGRAARIAAVAADGLARGEPPGAVAGAVAALLDALVRRVLALCEAELGPAPAPWAWIVLGSWGREEPTPRADQDHLLLHSDVGEGDRAWYAALAAHASDHLAAAGVPRCPGGFMANGWCGTPEEWRERIDDWGSAASPEALLDAAVLLDARKVAGPLDPAPLVDALLGLGGRPGVLRGLARAALRFRPPGALALRLLGRRARLHVKRQGEAPLVMLARCWALEARTPARGTAARLAAARDAGLLEAGLCAAAVRAHAVLLRHRLRAELGEVREHGAGLALAALTPAERHELVEALAAVRALRSAAAFHFRVDG